MIDKLLSKFGYINKTSLLKTPIRYLSEDEITTMSSELFLNQFGETIPKKLEEEVFVKLIGVDGLHEILSLMAARDIQRYFTASTRDQQLDARGAYARTIYLKSKISKIDKKIEEKKTKISGVRYA